MVGMVAVRKLIENFLRFDFTAGCACTPRMMFLFMLVLFWDLACKSFPVVRHTACVCIVVSAV